MLRRHNLQTLLLLTMAFISVACFALLHFNDASGRVRTAREFSSRSLCHHYMVKNGSSCERKTYKAETYFDGNTDKITLIWHEPDLGYMHWLDIYPPYRTAHQLREAKAAQVVVWRGLVVEIITPDGVIATDENPLRKAGRDLSVALLCLTMLYVCTIVLIEHRRDTAKNRGTAISLLTMPVTILVGDTLIERAADLGAYLALGLAGFGVACLGAAVAILAKCEKSP